MITLDWIYVMEKGIATAYTKNDITLTELLERSKRHHIHFVLCLKMPDDYFGGQVNYPHVCIDGSTYMQEQARVDTRDWDDLISQFTYAQVKAYMSERFGYTSEGPALQYTESIYYVTKGHTLRPHYCNIKDASVRDAPLLRWNMPDLVITKEGTSDCTFKNCIPVIDGKCFAPTYHEGELFVKEGATPFWYSENKKGVEIFLIDTTVLGALSIVPYQDCTLYFKNKINEPRDNCQWELQLPAPYRLDEYTVLPVIQGVIYLPSQYTKTSLSSISFHPHEWYTDGDTHRYRTEETVQDRTTVIDSVVSERLRTWMSTHPENNFLICIKNAQVYTHTSDVCRWIDYGMYLTKGECGLLRHKTTGYLSVYTKSAYSSFSLLSADYCIPRTVFHETKQLSIGVDASATPVALCQDHPRTDYMCFHLVTNRRNGVKE